MPSKQLVELVNNYKKAGIRIGFTKSRSQISLYLYEVQIPLNDVKPLADASDFLKEIYRASSIKIRAQIRRANLISVGQDGRHLPFVFLKRTFIILR